MRLYIALAVTAAAAFCAAIPAAAAAAVTDCPADPGAYTGSDPVVSELRAQRVDERAACLAETSHLDQLDGDVTSAGGAAHADAGVAHGDAGAAHDDAGAVKSSVEGVKASVDAVNASVASIPPGAAYNGPTSGQVDDAAKALHGDLWLFLGAGAALVFGIPFLRMVTPWWRS